MAVINRYTKTEPARFDPMSLQEMMLVPAYKRQQHDTLDESRSLLETNLAQYDSLDVHSDLLKTEQQKLYDKLQAQTELLNKEGFNPNSKSQFLKLNKEYQQAISPTGPIGKIQGAKKAYAQTFNDYIEDAVKNKKWSREDAIRNWNRFVKDNYTGFDERGNVTNIGQYGAPEKIELMQKLKDVKSILGEQVVKELTAGNYSFARQEDGSLAVVNKSGRRIETSNSPNIQSAMNMLSSELSDPNSAWNQSIMFEGVDPLKYQEQVVNGLNAMVTTKVQDNRSQNISFSGVENTNKNGTEIAEGFVQGISLKEGKIFNGIVNSITKDLQFDPTSGKLIKPKFGGNTYNSYEEKIKSLEDKGYKVLEDDKGDKYIYETTNTGRQRTYINKDVNHVINDFEKIKKESPFLSTLTDAEAAKVLTDYSTNLQSNFIDVVTPVGAIPEWLNTTTFGEKNGEGIGSTIHQKGVTINGKQITYDQVYKDLGFDNYAEFKENGQPSIQGYSRVAGKYVATVKDSNGNPKTMFIEGDEILNRTQSNTMELSNLILQGTEFSEISPSKAMPEYKRYFINTFDGNPIVIYSKRKDIKSSKDLINTNEQKLELVNKEDIPTSYSELSQEEGKIFKNSPRFEALFGVKE